MQHLLYIHFSVQKTTHLKNNLKNSRSKISPFHVVKDIDQNYLGRDEDCKIFESDGREQFIMQSVQSSFIFQTFTARTGNLVAEEIVIKNSLRLEGEIIPGW